MQEEDSCIRAKTVLCIGCHLEDPRTLVHVLDAILNGAEIGVGHSNPIPKVKLDVCPLEVTLQGNRNWSGSLHKILVDFYLILILKASTLQPWGPTVLSPEYKLIFMKSCGQGLRTCMSNLGAAWFGRILAIVVRKRVSIVLKWKDQVLQTPHKHGLILLLCYDNNSNKGMASTVI